MTPAAKILQEDIHALIKRHIEAPESSLGVVDIICVLEMVKLDYAYAFHVYSHKKSENQQEASPVT